VLLLRGYGGRLHINASRLEVHSFQKSTGYDGIDAVGLLQCPCPPLLEFVWWDGSIHGRGAHGLNVGPNSVGLSQRCGLGEKSVRSSLCQGGDPLTLPLLGFGLFFP
jgi:hypothetical protein